MADPSHHPHLSLSIPPYLRPPMSRQTSSTSQHSSKSSVSRHQPHRQNSEYIYYNSEHTVEAGIEDVFTENALHEERDETVRDSGDEPSTSPSADWDNLRDGSIARRPAWRRPSPTWMYPFIIGMAVALGMTAAPRSELYVNLACLSHPPRSPSSVVPGNEPNNISAYIHQYNLQDRSIEWASQSAAIVSDGAISINSTIPKVDAGNSTDTPGDAWFRKIQHDIYEYERNKRLGHSDPSLPASDGSTSSVPHSTQTHVQPSNPLPHPTMTMPGNDSPSQTGPETTKPTSGPVPSDDKGHTPYHEIDPKLCKRDPNVQAATAKLSMVLTLTAGLLGALTTGYWGQTSDRIGRKKLLMICEMGALINEICFVLVATYPYLAPGGYRSLLIGPTIEGLLGGFATMTATFHAYISDVTPDGSRATKFARLGGIMMSGFACGPILGAMIIRASGNILVPFYIAACVHIVFILFIFLLLPESLSSEARQILTKNAELKKEARRDRDAAERDWENETPDVTERPNPFLATPRSIGGDSTWSVVTVNGGSKRRKRLQGNAKRFIRRAFHFLEPLTIFLPREREDGYGKDWSLTMVAGCVSCISVMMGVLSVKGQYVFYAYGWTSAELGPYMSLVGSTRGFVLLVAMPVVVYYLKPRFTHSAPVRADSDPNASAFSSGSGSSSDTPIPTPSHNTARLDLVIARCCMAIELIPYIVIATNVNSTTFVLMTMLTTFGSPCGPSINSLALSLIPNSSEAGRLFGGLSVLHTIGSSLISPVLFGTLFSYTVGWYAPTVFIVPAVILCIAQVFLALVKLPGSEAGAKTAERGRSRQVKTVRSSSGVVLRRNK